jgi:vitamin B12/bleomycin/antimicrobial peptide transport system ATP-binding/permease protein
MLLVKGLMALLSRAETAISSRASKQIRSVFVRHDTAELYDGFIAPYFAQTRAKLLLIGIGLGHLAVLALNLGAIFAAAGFIRDMMERGFTTPSWYLYPAALCMIGAKVADSAVVTTTRLFVLDWYKWTQHPTRGLPLLLRAVRNRSLQALILSTKQEEESATLSGGEGVAARVRKAPAEQRAEQIMADDFMVFANLSVNLLVSAIINTIALVSYSAALFKLSPLVLAEIAGLAALRTGLAYYTGKVATRRNNEAIAAYARRRAGMMALADRAEELIANEGGDEAKKAYNADLKRWTKANTYLIIASGLLNLINGVFDGITRWIPLFYAQQNFFGLGYDLGAAGALDQIRGLTDLTGSSLNWYGLNADPIAQWRGAAERITSYILAAKFSEKARWPRYERTAPLELLIVGLAMQNSNGHGNISLDLKAGDALLITEGPIGGGKRILLHQLTGVLPHEEGSIVFGGISGRPGERMVLFQYPNITETSFREALSSLKTGQTEELTRKFSDDEIRSALIDSGFAESLGEAADDLLRHPGDDSLARIQLAKNGLSLPQVQMLQIARALLHRPAVLILDNATSALPPESVAKAYRLLRDKRPGGIVISFSDVHLKEKIPYHNKVGTFDPERNFTWRVAESSPPAAPAGLPPQTTAAKAKEWLRKNW